MQRMDQNFLLLWKRGIRRGILTATRGGHWGTVLGALFGILLILQILLFGLISVQTLQGLLRSRTDLRVEIQDTATDGQIQEFYSALNAEDYIEKTTYITKQQAYEYARDKDPDLVEFIEKFGMANPFPDTIAIELTDLSAYNALSVFVQDPRWQSIIDPTFLSASASQEKQVHELLRLTQTGESLSLIILFITGGVLIFIIIELVRRRVMDRSDEVLIERLVGAHPLMVFLPFATEATLLLWGSVVLSSVALAVLLWMLPYFLPTFQNASLLQLLSNDLSADTRSLLPFFIAIEIMVSPLIASIGAWWGIWPHTKSHILSLRSN